MGFSRSPINQVGSSFRAVSARPADSPPVVELGAGCALPSLLSTTLENPPSLVVITDYPDDIIMGNLTKNINTNIQHTSSNCKTICFGYAWGEDATTLL